MQDPYSAFKPSQFHAPAIYEYGYPLEERTRTNTNAMASNSGYPPFPGTQNEIPFAPRERGFHEWNFGGMVDDIEGIQSKAGKSIDPKLLTLLEVLKQLYVERRELFTKIFPGLHDEVVELLKKNLPLHARPDQIKVQTMQRSLSLGSPHTPSKQGKESPMRLERFKVRTINVGGVQQDGQGGGGDTKSSD